MADQQPGDAVTPPAGLPHDGAADRIPTAGQSDDGAAGTTVSAGRPDDGAATADSVRANEHHTEPAPVRWSGSATVPPPAPKRAWWSRRRPAAEQPAEQPEPASDAPTDGPATPAVDPWAGHDTPWDPMPAVPEERPPTRPDSGMA